MKKALIVWGGWEGHTPEAGASTIAGMLRSDGFAVEIADSTAAFANPDIHALDLIVPIITQSRAEEAEIANLVAAVESGLAAAGRTLLPVERQPDVTLAGDAGTEWGIGATSATRYYRARMPTHARQAA